MAMITTKEAAELLGVSVWTVYHWTADGYIPHYKLGAKLNRYDADEITQWAKKRNRAAEANAEN